MKNQLKLKNTSRLNDIIESIDIDDCKKSDLTPLETEIKEGLKEFEARVKDIVLKQYKPYLDKLAELRQLESDAKFAQQEEAISILKKLSKKYKIKLTDAQLLNIIKVYKLGNKESKQSRINKCHEALTDIKSKIKLLMTSGCDKIQIAKYKDTLNMNDVQYVALHSIKFDFLTKTQFNKLTDFMDKQDINYTVEMV